jgi:general secretion pathway protein G
MLKRLQEARKNEKGFTLIELLIVIVILGVLAGIVVFAVGGITNKGNASACKSDVKNVTVAVEAWYANQTGAASYPLNQAAAIAAVVPGYLHSWPTGTTVTYALVAGPPQTFTVTGANGTDTC